MRDRVYAIVAAVLLSAWIVGRVSAAEAACVMPSVTVDRTSVARGDVLEIRGTYFGTACNDTGGRGPVLGNPQTVISVKIVQGETVIPLAVVDAASNYHFAVQVTVPAGLAAGPALVTASSVQVGAVTNTITIAEGAVGGAASAPPTFILGRDSAAPRIEADEGASNARWIVAGVIVAGVAAAIGGVILFRRQQRRPYQWIQEPT